MLWPWPFEDCPIQRLTIGGEIGELRDFIMPGQLNILFAPEERLADYLRGLNHYDEVTDPSPYHMQKFGSGDRWEIALEGDDPCLRRI